MEKGCMVGLSWPGRPLLSGMSSLQFYPLLHLQKVDAGFCKAYWMRLRGSERLLRQHAMLFLESGCVLLFRYRHCHVMCWRTSQTPEPHG
jgi:hypothetical protein